MHSDKKRNRELLRQRRREVTEIGDIYDGAFRTILNDCRQMVLPLINEIFGEEYQGDETVEFHPNEHYMDQQDQPDSKRITDTNFSVSGNGKKKKYHLECESSLPDGRISIRLFEYDAQIALDEGEVIRETLTVTFPHTAVLYLRTYKKTAGEMRYVINTPGGTVEYAVPVIRVDRYSLDEIFAKHLLMLLPFYIFSHERKFPEYNASRHMLMKLTAEYREILGRLERLEHEGKIGAFDKRTIIELSRDVIRELAKKYENVQKGVGDIMSGALIETEARAILNIGKQEGRKEGKEENQRETALRMIRSGKMTGEEVAEYTGLAMEEVIRLNETEQKREALR